MFNSASLPPIDTIQFYSASAITIHNYLLLLRIIIWLNKEEDARAPNTFHDIFA